MEKDTLITQLNLAPHVEGGYFVRTYQSELRANSRALMSSIYYMLTNDSPIGYFHLNKSDVMHYFHFGSPIKYFTISPSGQLDTFTLGPDIAQGQVLQKVVKGGFWKASFLEVGEFGLLSEAVSPGFDCEDRAIGDKETLKKQFPHLWDQIAFYVRSS